MRGIVQGVNARKPKGYHKFVEGVKSLSAGKKVVESKKKQNKTRSERKNKMVEKDVEKKIILALKQSGFFVYKTGSGGAYDYNTHYNEAGIADLIVFGLPYGVTCLEVKQEIMRTRKDGGLKPKQLKFKKFCEDIGVRHSVVYNVRQALAAVSAMNKIEMDSL